MDTTDASPAARRNLIRSYRLATLSRKLKEMRPDGILEISIPSATGATSTWVATVLSTDLISALDMATKGMNLSEDLLGLLGSCAEPTTKKS